MLGPAAAAGWRGPWLGFSGDTASVATLAILALAHADVCVARAQYTISSAASFQDIIEQCLEVGPAAGGSLKPSLG